MLKLEGLKLAPEEKEAALHRRAARLLRIPEEDVLSVQVLRRSIDAREELHLVYTVAAEVRQEKQVLRRCRDRRVSRFAPERYALPEVLSSPEVPPVVVGAGPGGLFAALVLARCGLRPILLERGRDTTARQRDVETFWRTGVLDPESNVQFGEGGAGAFSDGKLNTGTKDLRHRWILGELVRCGAPESILTDAKPHVGTDMLHIALQNLRQELLSLGAQVRFGHRLEGLESRDGVLTGLHVRAGEGTYRLPVRAVVLAPGHSARDTFQMLYEAGVPMEAKPFAVGVRIEHRQRDMDAAQYRQYAGHPCLPASTYKLSCHTAAGRGVFSFCVCPGGQVVAAASEPGRVVESRDGVLTGLHVRAGEGTYRLPVRAVVLAPGHSARDTFQMLYEAGVPMEAKPFAVGVRIEHRQRDMDAAQYRQYAGHPCLPASTYKLSCHTAAGRGVFSFCVCPGGQVVAAASEPGRVVTNGMSHYARSGENINGGMLVGVTPEDFGTDHPLAGVAWQRQLEEAAFRLGGGGFLAPCQRVEDFLAHRPSTGPGAVLPSYRPGVTWCDLHDCLPSFLTGAMEEALPLLERKLRGYAQPDALLTAVETRSSSPVRILRDESGQSALRGLYPCGEGAGYAGGILSAAADGMRCAEKIWEVYS